MVAETSPAGETSRKTRLFLSYSRKDGIFAEGLHKDLEAQGYDVLMDRTDIAPGEDWQARLGRLLVESDTVVFCLSPRSISSRICQWEVEEAERLGKRILPVVAKAVPDADVPPSLARLNYIVFEGRPRADALQDLLSALATDLPWLREHTRLGELAQQWQARPGNAGVLRGAALEEAERWIASQPRNAALTTELHRNFISASRKAASTRQRWWIGGAAAVVALSLGLAGWSEINRREAVRQQTKAEKLALAATDASSALVFDIVSKFEDVAGMPVEVSHNILLRALKLQIEMAQADGATPELRHLMAVTMNQTSITFLKQGDAAAALLPAQGSVKFLQELAAEFPANTSWQGDLANSHAQLGDVLSQQGDRPGAKAAYGARHGLVEALAKKEPNETRWQTDLANSFDTLGGVAQSEGDYTTARAEYGKSLQLREKLAAATPGDRTLQRNLSVSHFKIGDLLVEMGDLSAALDSHQTGLRIDMATAASDPTNTQWQRDLSVSHSRVGELLMELGDPVRAEEQFRAGLAIDERLSASDPNRTDWLRDLSVSHSRTGEALEAQEKYADALRHFEAGLALDERLVARNPANADWQRDLSVSHATVGRMHLALNNRDAARTSFLACLAIREKLLAQSPASPDAQRDLAQILAVLGGLGEKPQELLNRAAKLYQDMRSQNVATEDDLGTLAEIEKALKTVQP